MAFASHCTESSLHPCSPSRCAAAAAREERRIPRCLFHEAALRERRAPCVQNASPQRCCHHAAPPARAHRTRVRALAAVRTHSDALRRRDALFGGTN
jgi:hypothetical protein